MGLSGLQVNLLLLSSVLCSLFSGVTFRYQQMQTVDGQDFSHPFVQCLTMFIGESLCYVVYMVYKRKYSTRHEESRQIALANGATDKINYLIFAIPTSCDFITSTISFFAMNMMPLSLNYMIRGGNIIVTALFSIIFLKRRLHRQHYLGLFLAVSGLAFMGAMSMLNSSDSKFSSSQILVGTLLTVGSFFTYASQMVLEEKLFSKFFLHPFQAVGYEGFWGLLITSIAIAIFNFVPCPESFGPPPNGNMEDFPNFIYQVFSFQNVLLFFLVILGIIIIILLNGIGLAVTKYASSIVRALLGVTSPFLVWMFCLAVGWETFSYYQLIAYIVITIGTLIYNEIIVIPVLGFNKNLKKHTKAPDQEPLLEGHHQSMAQHPFGSFHQYNTSNFSED